MRETTWVSVYAKTRLISPCVEYFRFDTKLVFCTTKAQKLYIPINERLFKAQCVGEAQKSIYFLHIVVENVFLF